MFFLKRYRPEFRDKVEVEQKGTVNVNLTVVPVRARVGDGSGD
jgi:hypothetical protein